MVPPTASPFEIGFFPLKLASQTTVISWVWFTNLYQIPNLLDCEPGANVIFPSSIRAAVPVTCSVAKRPEFFPGLC